MAASKHPKEPQKPKTDQAPARFGEPFKLRPTPEAQQNLAALEKNPALHVQTKAVKQSLGLLQQAPRYPGLNSHHFHSRKGPHGEPVRESYAQNRTPGAYRIFWYYGPGGDEITVIAITPHP
jgi:hypothetical protein